MFKTPSGFTLEHLKYCYKEKRLVLISLSTFSSPDVQLLDTKSLQTSLSTHNVALIPV